MATDNRRYERGAKLLAASDAPAGDDLGARARADRPERAAQLSGARDRMAGVVDLVVAAPHEAARGEAPLSFRHVPADFPSSG